MTLEELNKTLKDVHEVCKMARIDEAPVRKKVIDIYKETHPNEQVEFD